MADETDLLPMQATLRQDSTGEERRRIQARLTALRDRARRQMDAGVPPDEFRRLSALLDATEAAGEVVETAWKNVHGSSPD